ncbi:MAG: phosphoribosylanthranilate isomerase [Bacteroidales bacterium]|nr:phosphoribosylanthranilate isomerase [Bacteroidales bacterium]HPY82605.1 phosphoribosylanthranilate isomerase [Bacteroidales bacterium]
MARSLIKVCGMRDQQNIEDIAALPIDIIGFIFYSKSKRYVGEHFSPTVHASLPAHISRAGVFVNESIDFVCEMQKKHSLAFIQLHGNESFDYCLALKKKLSTSIIKAFQMSSDFDFETLNQYVHVCNFFLFDTKTTHYGGSGKIFDWNILEKYTGTTPFFLSGGIDSSLYKEITSFHHKALYGIDINSKFEIAPALKDIQKIKDFVLKL